MLSLLLPLVLLLATKRPRARRPPRKRRGTCTCWEHWPLFQRYGAKYDIPPHFLRALACRESNCKAKNTKGAAWGLMEVTETVRKAVPRENAGPKSRYSRRELLDPAVSVYLCCYTLRNVVRTYKRVNEPPNWTDLRWVGLVVAGWNAGYSVRAGVARVVKYLQSKGIQPTIDTVHAHARAAGAIRFLWRYPHRLTWWRSVVHRYIEFRRQHPTKGPVS